MKSVIRALGGAAIAAFATLASAQQMTMNFNDLGDANVFAGPDVSYSGFNFSSNTGTPDTFWAWAPGDSRFVSGAGPANNNNITGFVDVFPAPNQWEAFVVSSDRPFTFQSAFFSGGCGVSGSPCNSVFLELTPFAGGPGVKVGGWTNQAVDSPTINLHSTLGVGETFANGQYGNVQLREIVIWAYQGGFSVDDIKVTVVPEPSSYALMIGGLGVLALVARRRKNQVQR